MTETAASSTLANLPPLTTPAPVGSLRLLQGWLQGPARWVGWLIIPLVPVFIFTTALVAELMQGACYVGTNPSARSFWDRNVYDEGCLQNGSLAMGGISLLYVVFGALCLASTVAMLRRPRSTLTPAETTARLQGVKDWFVRGDIQEEDYQGLRKLIEGADDPKSVGTTARRGATLLRSLAVFLVPMVVFWVIFTGVFIDEMQYRDDEWAYFITWVVGGLVFLAIFIAAVIRASQLARFGRAFAQSLSKQIDAAEEQVMRAARARGGVRDAGPAASGASFRSYKGR